MFLCSLVTDLFLCSVSEVGISVSCSVSDGSNLVYSVIREFVYFATCFGQLYRLQVLHTLYEMLWEQIISIQHNKRK